VPRTSTFSPELAEIICDRLAEGESLRSICRDEDMPYLGRVFEWLRQEPAFADQYARAREAQGHFNADRAIEEAMTAQDASLGRLRYDALRWHASKMTPKVYGDKIQHTGADGTGNVVLEILTGVPRDGS